ncbi:prolipoprotein diacylglyceryl transferase [Asticcacaulis solisilvae]
MRLPDIDPVLIHLGPVAIRWYALAYVAGIVLGWLYAGRLLKRADLWPDHKPPLSADQLDDLILWLTGGVILGGRIGYILAYDASIIWHHPLDVFKVWEGGMSFHGGFTGVLLAAVLWCRRNNFGFRQALSLGDLLATVAPMGLLFGRLANFVNGELWGRATSLPWGMVFCNKYIKDQYHGVCPANFNGTTWVDIPRHPSQLYEAFGEGLLMLALLWFLGQRLHKLQRPGLIMGIFITGYGIIRILVETVRNPDEQMWGFFKNVVTMGQLLSLPMVIGGAWLIWRALKPDALPPAPAVPEPANTKTPAA